MRLPKKLSRSLLYVLLVVLSCIIIRDSLIILGVRYRLFVSQNIWLHEGRRKEVNDRNFESENHGINRQIEERKLNNKQAPRLRDLPPQERNKRRMEMMRQRQMRRQNRMAAKKQQPVNNNNVNGKNNNANGKNNNDNGKNNNANMKNNNANGNNNNANGKTNNVNGKNNNANGKNNNKKPDIASGIKDNNLLEYLKKNPFGFEVKDNQNKFKLVLLLAYPRSGSSFIGQVLSAYNHTMYFFEPLFVIIRQNYDLVSTEIAPTFLDKIFNCEPNITTYLKKKNFVVKSKGELCEAAKVVLVKTIRLRLKVALEWLQLNPEIKVIHLVRDPRGILASMKKGPFREKNTTMQCQYLYEDYQYGKQLHKSRYIRVKYEDFVDHPTKTFKRVFSFLNLPFSNDVEKSVTYHTKAEEMNVTVKAKPKMFKIGTYYSLYRYSDFRHDHTWIKLPKKRLEEIERGCEDVMKALGYHKKKP